MDVSVLFSEIMQQDIWEWTGLVTGLLYIWLAARQHILCWVFGIISCACIAYKSFADYKLLADGVLQVFYVFMGFVGLWRWRKARSDEPQNVIRIPLEKHILPVGVSLVLAIPLSFLLIRFGGARFGYPDTVLTLLSLYATLLLIRRDLTNWAFWIGIDVLYAALYTGSKAWLFAVLYLIYAIFAIYGLFSWKREWKASSTG